MYNELFKKTIFLWILMSLKYFNLYNLIFRSTKCKNNPWANKITKRTISAIYFIFILNQTFITSQFLSFFKIIIVFIRIDCNIQ